MQTPFVLGDKVQFSRWQALGDEEVRVIRACRQEEILFAIKIALRHNSTSAFIYQPELFRIDLKQAKCSIKNKKVRSIPLGYERKSVVSPHLTS